ncbi:hypothetical protein N1851_022268 [Merluccius polli]|uniref:Uncharacterized protein n=1 Tax=Merluccius polli TaxID=89951 RepID=A0AA47MI37_MERPO|nr:hypothetical protein N1851_022268 [Merluccius polli]
MADLCTVCECGGIHMVVGITGRDVTLPCWPRPHRHMGPPHAHRLETLPWFSCYGDTLLSTRGCSVTSRPSDQLLGRARDRDMVPGHRPRAEQRLWAVLAQGGAGLLLQLECPRSSGYGGGSCRAWSSLSDEAVYL